MISFQNRFLFSPLKQMFARAGPAKKQSKRIFEDLQRDHADINDFTSARQIERFLNQFRNHCLVTGIPGDVMPLKLVRFTEDCRFGPETVIPMIENLARVWSSEGFPQMETREYFDAFIKTNYPELASRDQRSRHLQAVAQCIRPFFERLIGFQRSMLA